MSEEELRRETVPLRIVRHIGAFLYAFYVGTAVFLFYCEFIVADAGGPRQQSIWQNVEMVVFGPILLCWLFLIATAIPASILIAVGEILMAGFYYYLVAGIGLAIWVYWDLHGHLPELFQVTRGQAPFEAYLAGSLTASLTFWHLASSRRTRVTDPVSK